jgi:hypothetical protein
MEPRFVVSTCNKANNDKELIFTLSKLAAAADAELSFDQTKVSKKKAKSDE